MEPRKILVVDDDVDIRKVVALNLTKLGHLVSLAGDGREAASEIAKTDFDVVITDVLMPEKDGLELIQEMRRKARSPRIVAMSGGGKSLSISYLELARRLGAHALLNKPFSSSELVAAVDAALSLRWARPSSE